MAFFAYSATTLWKVEDGQLKMSGGITGAIMRVIPRREFSDDYVVWVDTEWISGEENSTYGIFYGASNGRGYGFNISASGGFIVSRWDGKEENVSVPIYDWKGHSSIAKNGKNRLRIDVAGFKHTYYINSIAVASIVDSTYSDGRVGIGVSALQQVAFDNLSVAERSPLLKPIVTSQ